MKDYDKRKIEECHKLAKEHKLKFEDVMDLVLWVEWASHQKTKAKILKYIKKYV